MTVTETSIKRSIVLVEYIPLQVRAEKECAIADYSSFHKSDISLLELTLMLIPYASYLENLL